MSYVGKGNLSLEEILPRNFILESRNQKVSGTLTIYGFFFFSAGPIWFIVMSNRKIVWSEGFQNTTLMLFILWTLVLQNNILIPRRVDISITLKIRISLGLFAIWASMAIRFVHKDHPYITLAKGLGGWGQKNVNFCWHSVLFMLT